MSDPHKVLTSEEKNLCGYGAAFGVVLAIICLVQHTLLVIQTPLTNSVVPVYFFIIIAFLFLGLQKPFSILLLIVGTILTMIIEWLWAIHYSSSLVVFLLLMYQVILLVILFALDVPKKLKMKQAAEKADRDMWAGKI